MYVGGASFVPAHFGAGYIQPPPNAMCVLAGIVISITATVIRIARRRMGRSGPFRTFVGKVEEFAVAEAQA